MTSTSKALSGWAPREMKGRAMTAGRWIVDQVVAALLRGDIRPGGFLGTELEIARTFQVSRVAARDALRTLEGFGIINVRPGPGGGARINAGSPTRFVEALAVHLKLIDVSDQEVFRAQYVIEVAAAETAARNATPDDIRHLAELIEESEALTHDIDAFKLSLLEFHAAVTAASHNRILIALRESVEAVLPKAYSPIPSPAMIKKILNHHRVILALIKKRDADGVRDQLREHLDESWRAAEALRKRAKAAAAPKKSPKKS